MKKSFLWAGFVIALARAAFAQTELISNGGFEATTLSPWTDMQSSGWTEVGIAVSNNPAAANSGSKFLSMGNAAAADQGVYQLVTIPTNAVAARLTYYLGAASSSASAAAQFDAYIVNSGLNALTNFDERFVNNFNGVSSYFQSTYNLSNYLGQTIGILFRAQTDATLGSLIGFHIDDVSLLYVTHLPVNDYFTNRTILSGNSSTNTANNIFASKEAGEPKHAGVAGGNSLWWAWTAPSNGVVTISTDDSTFDTLLAVYTGSVVSNLTVVAANDDDNRGVTSRVKFSATAGVQYQIAVDGSGGASGNIVLRLNFVPDTKAPTIAISSPAAGAKLTNSTVQVVGTASDNIAVASVEYRLENADGTNSYQLAAGTNSWSATVANLIPGTNTIRVRATDTSGNVGITTRSFRYVIVSAFTLTTNGSGTVTPALNGQLLEIGTSYTLTAKPLTGYIFAGWSGDVAADTSVLTFTMQSNLMVQANFIPNPFAPVAGVYQGLFYDTNDVEHQSSGFFSATVSTAGKLTAKLLVAGKAASLSGQFSATGFASNNIVRKGLTPVSAQLHLDLGGAGLTGQLSDGTWTAELNAFRAGTNLSGIAGRYTVLLPGSDDAGAAPGGDGFGTVLVTSTGGLTFSGLLGDGSKVAQKVSVNAQGQWPFYAALYSGNGSILGWLTIADEANSDIHGAVSWFKLPQPAAAFYPAGFTHDLQAAGSTYAFTSGFPVLDFTDGKLVLSNGNLSSSFTNQITFGAANIVTNQSPNALKLTITTSTGVFKGTVVDPVSGRTIAVNGVVLQKQNYGGGYFLGTNQTGRVYLGP